MVGAIIGRYPCKSNNLPPNVIGQNLELDLRARELHKNGLKIPLPEQSIQILAMLLDRPGEVVTREEIQAKLADDTIVEFNHSINAAVKRLRQALGDSAENSRFVETLARRGYRFIASVEGIVAVGAGAPSCAGTGCPAQSCSGREGAPRGAPTELASFCRETDGNSAVAGWAGLAGSRFCERETQNLLKKSQPRAANLWPRREEHVAAEALREADNTGCG